MYIYPIVSDTPNLHTEKVCKGGCVMWVVDWAMYMFACGVQSSLACVCVGAPSFFFGASQSTHSVAAVVQWQYMDSSLSLGQYMDPEMRSQRCDPHRPKCKPG